MTTITFLLLACVATSIASPMLYKLNPSEKYEVDLVPISSTVIPLTVLEVSYGAGGKPSEEYKAAYLRKLRKQVLQRADKEQQGAGDDDFTPTIVAVAPADADSLITAKTQQVEKAKVKDV